MRSLSQIMVGLAIATASLFTGSAARAQNPAVGVAFRNDLKVPVIVQGWTMVNKMPRRGPAIVVAPGKTVWENNLPANSWRNFSVYDFNKPSVVYLRDFPVNVPNADLLLSIRPHATNPQGVTLKTEPNP